MASRFHIRSEAQSHLKNVIDALGTEAKNFEVFYICVITGLATNQKGNADPAATNEAGDNFLEEYASRGRLIVGLFLSREIRSRGIAFENKKHLHEAIAEYLDPRSPSQLNDEGVRQLSRYGYGGFEKLLEWFPDKPADLESFLPKFHERINSALGAA